MYVVNLPRWATEVGKLARGIRKNLLRKTVVPIYKGASSRGERYRNTIGFSIALATQRNATRSRNGKKALTEET